MSDREIVVLTGDIVRSSRLGAAALDAAMSALATAAGQAAAWSGGEARFTRFRGDGWQCLGPSPALALRTTLYFRAHLRSRGPALDSRVSVGIGPGTPALDLAAASGPAFEVSGRGLDDLPRTARFAVAWSDPPDGAVRVQAIFALAEAVSRRWTPRQAELFVMVLPPKPRPSQEAISAALGVRQQVVARHLAAGGDGPLRDALAALEGGA